MITLGRTTLMVTCIALAACSGLRSAASDAPDASPTVSASSPSRGAELFSVTSEGALVASHLT
ncbi:MAG: hypothetical protein ACHREM_09180, partial [Polyangiales bacterium]